MDWCHCAGQRAKSMEASVGRAYNLDPKREEQTKMMNENGMETDDLLSEWGSMIGNRHYRSLWTKLLCNRYWQLTFNWLLHRISFPLRELLSFQRKLNFYFSINERNGLHVEREAKQFEINEEKLHLVKEDVQIFVPSKDAAYNRWWKWKMLCWTGIERDEKHSLQKNFWENLRNNATLHKWSASFYQRKVQFALFQLQKFTWERRQCTGISTFFLQEEDWNMMKVKCRLLNKFDEWCISLSVFFYLNHFWKKSDVWQKLHILFFSVIWQGDASVRSLFDHHRVSSDRWDAIRKTKRKFNSSNSKTYSKSTIFSFIVFQHSSFYKQNVEMNRSVDIRRIERDYHWK